MIFRAGSPCAFILEEPFLDRSPTESLEPESAGALDIGERTRLMLHGIGVNLKLIVAAVLGVLKFAV